HDSHNIIAVGVDDRSIRLAVNRLAWIGGGQVVVDGDEVLAELPLPIAGLMSDQMAGVVARAEEELIVVAHSLGSQLNDPFMTLSFLALPVIPELKLTDKGLVDVNLFEPTSLYV
ncbi:MAG: adenine deaminase C-terminal domain-containing protein, partial [Candidatus Electryoneaceae bacterium]|nr:adenine deaminase C-terminal domain-containing protein [Candidatus Electryoneaceae bacterium]